MLQNKLHVFVACFIVPEAVQDYLNTDQVQVHLFTLIQFQYNNNEKKKEVKTEITIHWINHNKGKKCVAAKGAKLSSWLLPQSGYK